MGELETMGGGGAQNRSLFIPFYHTVNSLAMTEFRKTFGYFAFVTTHSEVIIFQ